MQKTAKKEVSANQITAELLIQIPRRWPNTMCWRNNTGRGIGWSQVKAAIGCLHRRDIEEALKLLTRPIGFGMVGSADIEIVAGPLGRLVAVEVKSGDDEQSIEQIAWQRRLESLGGAYIIAREVTEALEEIGKAIG